MFKTLLWYGIAEACISVLFDGLTKNLEAAPSNSLVVGKMIMLTLTDGEVVCGWYLGTSDYHMVLLTLVPSIGEYATLYFPCVTIAKTEVLG